MTKEFPILFKKSSQGKIEQWQISASEYSDYATITTLYGEVGGKLQSTTDKIREGKNIGKKNETNAYEQAVLEATSKYNKKLKSGYVDSRAAAEAGKIDKIIEGGVLPMLAHSFDKAADKITYPCAIQPKLDGIRCVAIKNGDDITLWTRTRKPITSCPHIIEAIRTAFIDDENIILDGELYNHDLKNDFEKIVSAVRKEEPSEESKQVEYHIYDCIMDGTFNQRALRLALNIFVDKPIVFVLTDEANDVDEAMELSEKFISQGYEGAMLRNWDSPYENKRSYNLQKVKEFQDDEFLIVGVEEGRGKLTGLVGAFVCTTGSGDTFKAKPMGDQEATRKFLDNPETVIGKNLTVKYQGLTKFGIPRFPIGKAVRDYE